MKLRKFSLAGNGFELRSFATALLSILGVCKLGMARESEVLDSWVRRTRCVCCVIGYGVIRMMVRATHCVRGGRGERFLKHQ